jgi:phospholipid-transporting ATPase
MSSKLINPQMHLLVLAGQNAEESEANMDKMLADMASLPPTTIFALVVPGDVLATVFSGPQQHKFLQIGTKCHSVICARVSPLQKALVVKLVRDNENAITLAIGDGANDVSMIQAAHVGVGIMGREGTQAVRAADYAFGEFRHLRRLVTVHGRYSLLRMTGLIYYSFYKNLVFITIQWWFGFVSDWTGQVML